MIRRLVMLGLFFAVLCSAWAADPSTTEEQPGAMTASATETPCEEVELETSQLDAPKLEAVEARAGSSRTPCPTPRRCNNPGHCIDCGPGNSCTNDDTGLTSCTLPDGTPISCGGSQTIHYRNCACVPGPACQTTCSGTQTVDIFCQ